MKMSLKALNFAAVLFALGTSTCAALASELVVEGGRVSLGEGTALISNWTLDGYRLGKELGGGEVTARTVTQQGEQLFFAPAKGSGSEDLFVYLDQVKGKTTTNDTGAQWEYEDDKIKITRDIKKTPGQKYLDVKITADFKSDPPGVQAFLSLFAGLVPDDPEKADRQTAWYSNNKLSTFLLADEKESIEVRRSESPVDWIGALDRYFVFAVVPTGEQKPTALVQRWGVETARMSLAYPISGRRVEMPLRVYFGPKDLTSLHQVAPSLDHTVDFGWLTWVAYPLLKLLHTFFALVGNYGWSIVLLTVVVKLATFPLTYKSMVSMKRMQVLQPQIKRLQERYKDDKARLQQEMLQFMKQHGYNPMSGCWPILIQMPIFFALYRVLYGAVELYQAPFIFWIHNLAAKDPYYVLPLCVALVWFLQQKMTPTPPGTDPMQQKIMQWMPVVFAVMMVNLPSGLSVYFLVNAALGIVQQVYINKKIGTSSVMTASAKT